MTGWLNTVFAVLGLLPYVSTFLLLGVPQNPNGLLIYGYGNTTAKNITATPSQTCGDTICYNGYCNNLQFPPKCICTLGFLGEMCHQKHLHSFFGYPYICLKPCANGECVTNTLTKQTECSCFSGYTGSQCDKQEGTVTTATPTTSARATTTAAPISTQTTKAKPPISTSTTSPTTSTPYTTQASTVPIHYYTCDKIATVINLVNQIPVNDTTGGSCPSGSSATPEAFVLDHCNVTSSSKWTQGVNIMEQCNDIPVYTPVATFSNHIYASAGGLCGVFLGCLPNGFKLGVQQCGNLPTIIHVNYGGLFTMNPNLYYTVQ